MKPFSLLLLCAALILLFFGRVAQGAEDLIDPLKTEADEALLFVAFVIILAGALILVFIIVEVKFHWLPESVAVLIYGILIGLVLHFIKTPVADHLETFDPELFFLFLLPSIIFESGFSLQKTPFFSNIGSILTLAVFGTTISFAFIGGALYLFSLWGMNYPLTLQEAMTSGALLSTTDTVATLAIFQALNVDQQLYMIVFGESVLNDAVGFILFRASENYESGQILSTFYIFLIVAFGSLFLGIGVAILLSAILRFIHIHRYPPLETIFMIMFSYLSYVLADSLKLSGIMSVFWCGVAFNHYGAYSLSPYTTLTSRQLFRTLAFVCETSVFIYLGISLPTVPLTVDVRLIFCIIFACLAGRAVHVYVLCNILNFFKRDKLTMRMQTAIWFSGLMRGGLAFGLSFDLYSSFPVAAPYIKSATLIFVHVTLFAMGCGTLPLLKVLKIESASTDQSLEHISQPIRKTPQQPRDGTKKITNFMKKIDNNYLKVWLRRPMPPLAQEAIELFDHLVKNSEPRPQELPEYTRNHRPVREEFAAADQQAYEQEQEQQEEDQPSEGQSDNNDEYNDEVSLLK